MRNDLVRRILRDFVKAFEDEKGVGLLRKRDSKKYVGDVSGIDSNTQEANFIRMAMESGAFENFYDFNDYDAAYARLDEFTGWKDEIIDDMIRIFAEAMSVPMAGSPAADKQNEDASYESETSDDMLDEFDDDGLADEDPHSAPQFFIGSMADRAYATAMMMIHEKSWSEGDFEKSFGALKDAADLASADAMLELLKFRDQATVVLSDLKAKEYRDRALREFIRIANEQQDNDAMVKAGDMLRMRDYGKFAEAFKWYDAAAAGNCATAMCRIGEMYEAGEGTQQNISQSIAWYERSADCGCAEGMYRLSLALEKKSVRHDDLKKAFLMLTMASERGSLEAMFKIGTILHGISSGDDRYGRLAESYCIRAALLGEADACFWCYKHGMALKSRIEWLVKSAFLGSPQGAYAYALTYELKEGPEYSVKNQQHLPKYERAAILGSVDAMLFLGKAYFDGKVVRRNFSKSFVWYEMAAKHGNMPAMNRISQMIYSGVGTAADRKKAEEWFDLAEKSQSRMASGKSGGEVAYPSSIIDDWMNRRKRRKPTQ